jgi:nucleosome binding factor SPN SPT16 subunit
LNIKNYNQACEEVAKATMRGGEEKVGDGVKECTRGKFVDEWEKGGEEK